MDSIGNEMAAIVLIEANGEDFVVHLNKAPDYNKSWFGTATQIQKYSDEYWEYQSKQSSATTTEFKDARVWFEWSFTWRGVWEGRIYFKEEEHWSEEMKTIPELWDQIEKIVKEKIKADNPEYKWFD